MQSTAVSILLLGRVLALRRQEPAWAKTVTLFNEVVKKNVDNLVTRFINHCLSFTERLRKKKTFKVLYIEISLQGVRGNRESRGRSNFLSYVTFCSHIGSKKQLIHVN